MAGRETNVTVRILYSFLKFSFMDFPVFGKSLVIAGFQISSLFFSSVPSFSFLVGWSSRDSRLDKDAKKRR